MQATPPHAQAELEGAHAPPGIVYFFQDGAAIPVISSAKFRILRATLFKASWLHPPPHTPVSLFQVTGVVWWKGISWFLPSHVWWPPPIPQYFLHQLVTTMIPWA